MGNPLARFNGLFTGPERLGLHGTRPMLPRGVSLLRTECAMIFALELRNIARKKPCGASVVSLVVASPGPGALYDDPLDRRHAPMEVQYRAVLF